MTVDDLEAMIDVVLEMVEVEIEQIMFEIMLILGHQT